MLKKCNSQKARTKTLADQAEAHRQKAKAARERRVIRQAKKKADLLGLNTEEEEEDQTTTQK
ncbi:9568_t:CDS:2 [Entrophospora sp. SA101]|nr:9568_t:CDS:2 [Entrophospora sp. SA101]